MAKTKERIYIESLLFNGNTYSFKEICTLVECKFPNEVIPEKRVRNAVYHIRQTEKYKKHKLLTKQRTEFSSNINSLDSALSSVVADLDGECLLDRIGNSNIPIDLCAQLYSKAVELKQIINNIKQCTQ